MALKIGYFTYKNELFPLWTKWIGIQIIQNDKKDPGIENRHGQ
jgi:hypothetical protein